MNLTLSHRLAIFVSSCGSDLYQYARSWFVSMAECFFVPRAVVFYVHGKYRRE